MRGHRWGWTVQPLPSVEPALLLADLLEESEANVLPALDSAALDGLPISITSSLWASSKAWQEGATLALEERSTPVAGPFLKRSFSRLPGPSGSHGELRRRRCATCPSTVRAAVPSMLLTERVDEGSDGGVGVTLPPPVGRGRALRHLVGHVQHVAELVVVHLA